MDIQQFFEFCLSKRGVSEHFPFDKDTLVFKVAGKIFALSSLRSWEIGTPTINLKCDPEKAEEFRASFNDIKPGYHMSKRHWNTLTLNGDVSDSLALELINHSYNLVFSSLPRKTKEKINMDD
ncbi:MAG TPA: MmcQ/YjbR family DNA-binding protein [Flavobacterium sp.]|jgi:predicted DNA-binding protein (MmcQ/YjbR family)